MDAQTLLSRVSESLSVRRAFGDPVERDGFLVIPVAFVAGGGGGGEGQVAPPGRFSEEEGGADRPDSDDRPQPSPPIGSGGGLGGVIWPLGVYVVRGDKVTWKPVVQPMLLAIIGLGLVRLILRAGARAG
jgi:uncharacterized spore protein YtfJ